MRTKVQKWGNSYAVRLPKKLVEHLGLTSGSQVIVGEKRGAVVVTHAPTPRRQTKTNWRDFVIPTQKNPAAVSDQVDRIVYGDPA